MDARSGPVGPAVIEEQPRQNEWTEQWTLFADHELSLFRDWIYPNRIEDFAGKAVLDCGCGGGQHVGFCAPFARLVVGVDLNTATIARDRNRTYANAHFVQGDIARIALRKQFDVVYCVGVIHHTVDPDATFENLKRLCHPGGRLVIWCYSSEGNGLMRSLIEPWKGLLVRAFGRHRLRTIAQIFSVVFWMAAHTLYRFPLTRLPYYEYIAGLRVLNFSRIVLNVFDKLNAPITHFIPRHQVEAWFNRSDFKGIHISSYQGVSWRASGTLRRPSAESQ